MAIDNFARFLRTLRYLKPVQIFGRLKYRITSGRIDLSPPPSLRKKLAQLADPPLITQKMTSEKTFKFLNDERTVTDKSFWNSKEILKLWLYNLHYFDDLRAICWQTRAQWHNEIIKNWIAENRPGVGNGWEPYPISLRLVNLIFWRISGGGEMVSGIDKSIAVQVRYLQSRIEHHLLGNHILANAKALISAGLYFDGAEADEFYQSAMAIMERELPEQILGDGGHFERSPMYHSIILFDLLDILNLHRCYGKPAPRIILDSAKSTLVWLSQMIHPDGEIPLFNDSAFGVAPAPAELFAYANLLGLDIPEEKIAPLLFLKESGYAKLRTGVATLFCDLAPLGPSYLPAHGHADTLGFEMSIGTQRVFVDSGTSCYEPGEKREDERSTRAHNCLVIDGENSSEVWASFRVGRRANITSADVGEDDGFLYAQGAHDGYAHLGVTKHHRRFCLFDKKLEITDRLEGSGGHTVELFFHLHPDVDVVELIENIVTVKVSDKKTVTIKFDDRFTVSIENGHYHPMFGQSIENKKIVGRSVSTLPDRFITSIEWQENSPE